ncbi:unnamed protein product [[Candida] boidinii]|nr:hypothetical protein B5S33_g1368 [[Candida] boidinii]GME86262.1 unnamed protein product [[Candida] boidinii]
MATYEDLMLALSPIGRLLFLPLAIFSTMTQFIPLLILNFTEFAWIYMERISKDVLMINHATRRSKSKDAVRADISLSWPSINSKNSLYLTRYPRHIPYEIQLVLYSPPKNIYELIVKTWIRSEYFWHRFAIHAPVCVLKVMMNKRASFTFSPDLSSLVDKPANVTFYTNATSTANTEKVQSFSFEVDDSDFKAMETANEEDDAVKEGKVTVIENEIDKIVSAASINKESTNRILIEKDQNLNEGTKLNSENFIYKIKIRKPYIKNQINSSFHKTRGNYDLVRQEILNRLDIANYDDGSIAPNIVRFTWHCCATYDQRDGTGGSNGATMRFPPEINDDGNTGLHTAKSCLDLVKLKFPWITYADLYTLGGVVAIESMGCPTIDWKPGRIDFADDSKVPPNGRLPLATKDANHIRTVFQERMGFSDRETVLLIGGGHSLGRCHAKYSGFKGKWTGNPLKFDNDFFKLLMSKTWNYTQVSETGNMQYTSTITEGNPMANNDDELMMLNTDIELIKDTNFKKWVNYYANNEIEFLNDFAIVFGKLLELGVDR